MTLKGKTDNTEIQARMDARPLEWLTALRLEWERCAYPKYETNFRTNRKLSLRTALTVGMHLRALHCEQ